jgi:acetyltransferase-like isoleucine patch superfamily enzyme
MTFPRVASSTDGARLAIAARVGWTIVTILVVETLLCGAALFPIVVIWSGLAARAPAGPATRLALVSVALVPLYVLFALLLMLVSGVAVRVMRWRTPCDLETPLAKMDWPLLHWARYMVAIHLVRLIAGALFRGSPVWTMYLRLAGARLGRRVYVNSLALTDYNLLEFGDDVVIGDGVHLSGHTVEHGVLKTARVRIGRNVTIGVGSIIDIGVDIGDGCEVGALTLVPKHSRLESGSVYAGIPAQRLGPPASRWKAHRSVN